MGKPSIGWRRSATSSIEINSARLSRYPKSQKRDFHPTNEDLLVGNTDLGTQPELFTGRLSSYPRSQNRDLGHPALTPPATDGGTERWPSSMAGPSPRSNF